MISQESSANIVFNSCFSLPSLFQRLGRMSLVQLRTLIWLTILDHERERNKDDVGMGWLFLPWDRLIDVCLLSSAL